MYARGGHHALFDDIISLCRLAGFSPTIVQEAANETALISLVAAGLGVALEWKEDRHFPWLQELRRIARKVQPRTVINEQC